MLLQAVVTLTTRTELLQALAVLLFLLFPSHDPLAGLASLGGAKPLQRAIKRLRTHPAVLAYAEVPAVTMALLQYSPYLLAQGKCGSMLQVCTSASLNEVLLGAGCYVDT